MLKDDWTKLLEEYLRNPQTAKLSCLIKFKNNHVLKDILKGNVHAFFK